MIQERSSPTRIGIASIGAGGATAPKAVPLTHGVVRIPRMRADAGAFPVNDRPRITLIAAPLGQLQNAPASPEGQKRNYAPGGCAR